MRRAAAFVVFFLWVAGAWASENFVIVTKLPGDLGARIEARMEECRREVAEYWLGQPLPRWYAPAEVEVRLSPESATDTGGGATTYTRFQGQVFGWHVVLQGREDQILNSIIPHEVTHMVLASWLHGSANYIPRWLNEGTATMAEPEVVQLYQLFNLKQVWEQDRIYIPLHQLLGTPQYRLTAGNAVLFYAESYAVCRYLFERKGKDAYLDFLARCTYEPKKTTQHLQAVYGLSAQELERGWQAWWARMRADLGRLACVPTSSDCGRRARVVPGFGPVPWPQLLGVCPPNGGWVAVDPGRGGSCGPAGCLPPAPPAGSSGGKEAPPPPKVDRSEDPCKDVKAELAALRERLVELEKRLAAREGAQSAGASKADVEAVQARVTKLEAQVADLSGRLTRLEGGYEEVGVQLKELESGQAALASEWSQVRSRIDTLLRERENQLGEVQERLRSLEERVKVVESANGSALSRSELEQVIQHTVSQEVRREVERLRGSLRVRITPVVGQGG